MNLQNLNMILAIYEKKLAIFASTGNYISPCLITAQLFKKRYAKTSLTYHFHSWYASGVAGVPAPSPM